MYFYTDINRVRLHYGEGGVMLNLFIIPESMHTYRPK